MKKLKQPSSRYNFQKGFTLLEILISITFFLLLAVGGTAAFGPWTKFKRGFDTDERLTVLKTSIASMYKNSAWYIDDGDGFPVPYLDTGRNLITGINGMQTACDPTEEDSHDQDVIDRYSGLLGYSGREVATTLIDGYNRPFCFFVSERQSRQINGVTLYFHNIGVLSKGENGTAQMKWDPVKGTFELDPDSDFTNDDKYFIYSGWDLQASNYKILRERMERIARSYQIYFSSRYKFDQKANASYNYFHAEGCPSGHNDTAPSGANCPYSRVPMLKQPMALNNEDPSIDVMMLELGISPADTVTPWVFAVDETDPILLAAGNNLMIQNACPDSDITPESCPLRTPSNGLPPPYTAWVGTFLPGQQVLSTITIGVY